jgi:hypothetical protein
MIGREYIFDHITKALAKANELAREHAAWKAEQQQARHQKEKKA